MANMVKIVKMWWFYLITVNHSRHIFTLWSIPLQHLYSIMEIHQILIFDVVSHKAHKSLLSRYLTISNCRQKYYFNISNWWNDMAWETVKDDSVLSLHLIDMFEWIISFCAKMLSQLTDHKYILSCIFEVDLTHRVGTRQENTNLSWLVDLPQYSVHRHISEHQSRVELLSYILTELMT